MGKGEYDNAGYPQGYSQGYPMDSYNQPISTAYGGPQNQTSTNVIQVGGMQSQQPHQTTVVMQTREPMPSMCGYICFSCIVYWLFCCLFGFISFFIAIGGQNASSPQDAKNLGHASLGMSIAGLLIGIAGWICIALLLTGIIHWAVFNQYCTEYGYSGYSFCRSG